MRWWAVHVPQRQAICLYYRYHADEIYPAMLLFESPTALTALKDFQATAQYNGAPVEIASEVESVLVSGADGGLGTLVSTGLEASNLCGGGQTPTNRALLWRSRGRTFVLFAFLDQLDGRGFLSKLEMRQLAESLNGVEVSSTDMIDPERLLSVESAERLTGLNLKAPALMLASLRLDHIAWVGGGPYRAADEETRMALLYTGQPVGDGRKYHMLFFQTWGSQTTLENLALAGGYQPVTVAGQPAIYRQDCWEPTGSQAGCMSLLTWFENGVQFDIEAFLPAALPKETLIAIAESMR